MDEKYYEQKRKEGKKEKKGKIDLIINDDKIINIDTINTKRRTCFNKDYDIAIIELKKNDNIKNFLELDDHLFNDGEDVYYKDKSIYILQYPNGDIAKVSYGTLGEFTNYNVIHFASTLIGSSGSPILDLQTNKVIAIHKGHKDYTTKFNFNLGTFLKIPLNDFKNKINEDKKDNKNNKDININNDYIKIKIKKKSNDYNLYNNKNKEIKSDNNIKNKEESNNTNNNSIKDKNSENNEKNNSNSGLISKVSKIHVIFKSGGYGTPFELNYGTTVDEMLKQYLKKIKRDNLYGKNDKINFKYDSEDIKFGNETPIGKFFEKNNLIPRNIKIEVAFN